jgi:hypothetical protein
MKAFDHANPTTKDEWFFAFVAANRKLRPEIGERYARPRDLGVQHVE